MGIRSHDKAPSLVCDHRALGIVLGTLAFRELITENTLSASDSVVRIVEALLATGTYVGGEGA